MFIVRFVVGLLWSVLNYGNKKFSDVFSHPQNKIIVSPLLLITLFEFSSTAKPGFPQSLLSGLAPARYRDARPANDDRFVVRLETEKTHRFACLLVVVHEALVEGDQEGLEVRG